MDSNYQHDVFEALIEGRYQPEIAVSETKDGFFIASTEDGTGRKVSVKSNQSSNQAIEDLQYKIRDLALEGNFSPSI